MNPFLQAKPTELHKATTVRASKTVSLRRKPACAWHSKIGCFSLLSSAAVQPSEIFGSTVPSSRWTIATCARRRQAGQALLEFALILMTMLILVMGLVDFGRIFLTRQTLTNLSREGANLAARGTALSDTADALVLSATPLNIDRNGRIIVTSITRDTNGILHVIGQEARGGQNFSSRVGTVGARGTAVHLPVPELPGTNQTLIAAEVFYTFQAATPVGNLLGRALPTALYDVAYF